MGITGKKRFFYVLVIASAILLMAPVPVAYAEDNSEVALWCASPTTVIIGIRYTVEVPFKNLGDSAWTKAGNYSLGLIDPIGTECAGTELDEGDYIKSNDTKRFQLGCIPLLSDKNKTTITVRMMRSGEYFGETGVPCSFLNFYVVNHCEHNAVNGVCNKYCGADERCHNIMMNSSIDPYNESRGFCDDECQWLAERPQEATTTTEYIPESTTTSTSTSSSSTGSTSTTLQIIRICPEGSTYSEIYSACVIFLDAEGRCPGGYELRENLCLYTPRSQQECPEGSTYLQEINACVFYPTSESICPEGYELSGNVCLFKPVTQCPEGSTYSAQDNSCIMTPSVRIICRSGFTLEGNMCVYNPKTTEECPQGSTYLEAQGVCMIYPDTQGNCPIGYDLVEDLCVYTPRDDLQCPVSSQYSNSKKKCVIYLNPKDYCPETFDLKDNECVYMLSKNCGDRLLQSDELCDYNVDATKWTAERASCIQGKSAALRTCSRSCIPVYYTEKCVIGKCGADCSVDSDCNDNNDKTADSCNISSCTCTYAAAQTGKGAMPLLTKLIIALSIIAAILLAVFIKMRLSEGDVK